VLCAPGDIAFNLSDDNGDSKPPLDDEAESVIKFERVII
jgi:hypothetical protein